MKEENPGRYSEIQRTRWKSLFKKYGKQICGSQKKVATLRRRHGTDYFRKLALSALEKTPLNKRGMKVARLTRDYGMGLVTRHHESFEYFNVDFVYDNRNRVAEEVLGFKKKKSSLFFELLVIEQKCRKLLKGGFDAFLVTTWQEKQLSYKIERFPVDLMLWALEKDMMPIFLDLDFFQGLRRNVLAGKRVGRGEVRLKLEELLAERKTHLKKGAESQCKQELNEFEKEIEKTLVGKKVFPVGKKILKTKFNTFTVTDNFFSLNGTDYAVFASKSDIEGAIGSAALVKELVDENIKTVCILQRINPKKKHFLNNAKGKIIKSYVDYFFSSEKEFEKWALSSAW